jgi:hypothetical protein
MLWRHQATASGKSIGPAPSTLVGFSLELCGACAMAHRTVFGECFMVSEGTRA